MTNIVTIEGYRQRGKTHAALALAAQDAQLGRTVVWVGQSARLAEHAFRLLAGEYLHPALVDRAVATNGRQRIELIREIRERGGGPLSGVVLFKGPISGPGYLTKYVDSTHTFIFDEAPVPYGFTKDNPRAHIYVTVLPPGGDDL